MILIIYTRLEHTTRIEVPLYRRRYFYKKCFGSAVFAIFIFANGMVKYSMNEIHVQKAVISFVLYLHISFCLYFLSVIRSRYCTAGCTACRCPHLTLETLWLKPPFPHLTLETNSVDEAREL